MLLLKKSQVEFQDVINPDSDRPMPIIGVLYQNRLFKHLKSFPKDKLDSTRQLSHQLSLDPTAVCLMLEEADRYTVWSQDVKLQSYEGSQVEGNITTPISKIDYS